MDYMTTLGQKTMIYKTNFNQINHVTNVLESSTNDDIKLPQYQNCDTCPHHKKPINGTCHYVCIPSPNHMADEIN